MKISTFGNSFASLYTLENKNNMKVTITDIGATIVDIIVPDKNGNPVDVLLGYATPEAYMENEASHGATVGRIANRIGGACFDINGVTYNLEKNKGENTLHSGTKRYAHRMWYPRPHEGEEAVTFSLISPDGDQGMPGRALIDVTFSLLDDNRLRIDYNAVSDKDTYFNITNHSYFNLNGHNSGDCLGHSLCIDADAFTPTGPAQVPTGEIRSLRGTPLDFIEEKVIGREIDADYEQLTTAGGYDHNYILNHPGMEKPFATARGDVSGIVLEAYTDMPAVQLYTGNFLGTGEREKGGKYQRRAGFCLETQYYPDTPNHPEFPSCLYKAGEAMKSTTVYRFFA